MSLENSLWNKVQSSWMQEGGVFATRKGTTLFIGPKKFHLRNTERPLCSLKPILPKPIALTETCCIELVRSQPLSMCRRGGGSTRCHLLSPAHSHGQFFLSSPDNQRCKSHANCGPLFLSRKVYNVHIKHKKIFPLMKRIWWAAGEQRQTRSLCPCCLLAHQLALPALLLFDSDLLWQVQICLQITLGRVAGKFSWEAAITRHSFCLSMLCRTRNLFCTHLTVAASRDAVPSLLK